MTSSIKINPASDCYAFATKVLSTPGLCDDYVIEALTRGPRRQSGAAREAALTGAVGPVMRPSVDIVTDVAGLTRSAVAAGRRWLAADSGLEPGLNAQIAHKSLAPAGLRWDPVHQLYSWVSDTKVTPEFASVAPCFGDELALVVSSAAGTRVAVGSCHGYARSPFLAVTEGRRTRDLICLADYDSRAGDCGSLVMSRSGVVGLHCGTLVFCGKRYNAFYPFVLPGLPVSDLPIVDGTQERQSGRAKGRGGRTAGVPTHVRALPPPPPPSRAVVKRAPAVRERDGPPPTAFREGGPILARTAVGGTPSREAGIVGMSPAPSDLPSRHTRAVDPNVEKYIAMLMNPWAASPCRLPDHVVVPTSLARFVANRTYTFANTSSVGGNFLFGLSNRLNTATSSVADIPLEAGSFALSALATPPTVNVVGMPTYSYSPGCILTPCQWGLGSYADPAVKMSYGNPTGALLNGPWGDDFGASLAQSLAFMSAYRVLSMAIRTRIVGLPPSQFMAPGKIYFAQVRCDHSDLPVTEQDFVTMEQLGRATHVSADAVRASGSKTVFFTPDGPSKFDMTSNFLPPPGIFGPSETTGPTVGSPGMGVRLFPGHVTAAVPVPYENTLEAVDFTRNIVPYNTQGSQVYGAITPSPATLPTGSAADSANADSCGYLFMGYFGGQDGVVLEVDYATVAEYIPTKNSPGGIEALVQLPSSGAMDNIFAAAAVLTEAKPVMLQQDGDLTISGSSGMQASTGREGRTSAGPRAGRLLRALAGEVNSARGSAYREGFWDFAWLKKGSLGDGNFKWDFSK